MKSSEIKNMKRRLPIDLANRLKRDVEIKTAMIHQKQHEEYKKH